MLWKCENLNLTAKTCIVILFAASIAFNLFSNLGISDYHSSKYNIANPIKQSHHNTAETQPLLSNPAILPITRVATEENQSEIVSENRQFCTTPVDIIPIVASDDDSTTAPFIFQIGINKAGTRTMDEFFRSNHISSIHYRFNEEIIAKEYNNSKRFYNVRSLISDNTPPQPISNAPKPGERVLYNLLLDNICDNSGNLTKGVFYPLDARIISFSDFNAFQSTKKLNNHYLFEWIDNSYPNSIFIHNYRFVYKWLLSRAKWSVFIARQHKMSFGGRNTTHWINDVLDLWFDQYWQLTCDVINYFSVANIDNTNGGKLILFDIETEFGDEFSHKLEQWYPDLNASVWGHSHYTKETKPIRKAYKIKALQILNTTDKYHIHDNTALDAIQRHCNFSVKDPNFATIIF